MYRCLGFIFHALPFWLSTVLSVNIVSVLGHLHHSCSNEETMIESSNPVRLVSCLINPAAFPLLSCPVVTPDIWSLQESRNIPSVSVCPYECSYCKFCLILSACTHACLCVCSAVAGLVKVSSNAGSCPSHGSSADFAEWLVACYTAHPMTGFNEN